MVPSVFYFYAAGSRDDPEFELLAAIEVRFRPWRARGKGQVENSIACRRLPELTRSGARHPSRIAVMVQRSGAGGGCLGLSPP